MFKNIFKRCWIAEEVVRYLESLPRFFRVSYTVDVGGRSVKFPIRDEDGNLYDFNRHDRRVTGIVVNYQDNDYGCETYYVDDIVDAKCIPYMKEKFDKLFERFPVSKAKIKAKHLYDMQCKLRKRVVLSEDGTVKTKRPQKKACTVVSGSAADTKYHPEDIEPLNAEDL